MKTNYSISLLFFLLLTQCQQKNTSTKQTTTPKEPSSLINSWQVYRLPANSLNSIAPDRSTGSHPFQITFTKNEGILLQLSVNTCGMRYTIKNNLLCFGENISCTEACCDSGTDEYILDLCNGCLEYNIHVDTLTIFTPTDSILFTPITK